MNYLVKLNGVDPELMSESRLIEYANNRLEANPEDKEIWVKVEDVETACEVLESYNEQVVYYILEDWAGNQLSEQKFETFDSTWDYIRETYEETDFEDLYAIEKIYFPQVEFIAYLLKIGYNTVTFKQKERQNVRFIFTIYGEIRRHY